jgi:hypothetical protein
MDGDLHSAVEHIADVSYPIGVSAGIGIDRARS